MTPAPDPVYLFAGDSLTEGLYGESYVERVAKMLYDSRAGRVGDVVNAGRSGDTVRSLLERIDGPLERNRPDWVILAIGANDVWLPWLSAHSPVWWSWLTFRRFMRGLRPTTDLDQFAAAYRALIGKARAQAGTRVLACTVSPVGEQLASPVNRQLARLNGVIKHVAADCQVPVADVWQAFVNELTALSRPSSYVPGEWLFLWLDRQRLSRTTADEISLRRRLRLTFDGIHLNSRGADLWASTVTSALAQAEGTTAGSPPAWAHHLGLPCFDRDPIQICYTPGWETRARNLGNLLADAYSRLAALTNARPAVHLAVLNQVHWTHSAATLAYPQPAMQWDTGVGTVFVPEAYAGPFLRDLCLPETLAAWQSWPPALVELGELARATALVDLLAIQELARVFLRELRLETTNPDLDQVLAAYLAQVVIHARRGKGTGEMAALWDAWGNVLAQSGHAQGQVRLQARALFEVYGDRLAEPLAQRPPFVPEPIEALPEAGDLEPSP